jgi:predicted metal-dependent phosphotriesterase family hydrolase
MFPKVGGMKHLHVNDAIERLRELKRSGIGSIVDLTVIKLGRYIPRIQRIAEATDLNFVVATGVYTYNDVPHYFTRSLPKALWSHQPRTKADPRRTSQEAVPACTGGTGPAGTSTFNHSGT